VLINSIQIYI